MHELSQSVVLTTLTHADPAEVKALAEQAIPLLGQIAVLQNRTGLVMLPAVDSAEGTRFHLGEVLVAEAHIRIESGAEGYGMVLGRDVEFAVAVAVLDAAWTSQIMAGALTAFLEAEMARQAEADRETLRKVEATRVVMETF